MTKFDIDGFELSCHWSKCRPDRPGYREQTSLFAADGAAASALQEFAHSAQPAQTLQKCARAGGKAGRAGPPAEQACLSNALCVQNLPFLIRSASFFVVRSSIFYLHCC